MKIVLKKDGFVHISGMFLSILILFYPLLYAPNIYLELEMYLLIQFLKQN